MRSSAEAGGAFATPTIVHFGAVLGLAGILSAPWDAMDALFGGWANSVTEAMTAFEEIQILRL